MGTLIVGIILGILIIIAVSTYIRKIKKGGCCGGCNSCNMKCQNFNKKN